MSRPLLTIGMPTHSDCGGVWMTIQSTRLMLKALARSTPDARGLLKQTEFLVVNQEPDGEDARQIKGFLSWVHTDVHSARLVDAPDPPGSAPAKNRVFREAAGEIVMCVDCHVLSWPRAILGLVKHFQENPTSRDLIHGPLIYDDLLSCSTHQQDVWSSEQWGQWTNALRCPCGCWLEPMTDGKRIWFRSPATLVDEYQSCPDCGLTIPEGSALMDLYRAGFRNVVDGHDSDAHWLDDPFEIWGQGTGLIACRKEAWPGFPPGMKGFGAEEIILQEWTRRRGGKALLLPALGWTHRFLKPPGTGRYRNDRWDKARNYWVAFQSLGRDVEPIYRHFVSLDTGGNSLYEHLMHEHRGQIPASLSPLTSQNVLEEIHRRCKISEEQWEAILNGADRPPGARVRVENRPVVISATPEGVTSRDMDLLALEEWYKKAWKTPSDINEHCPTLRALAEKCDHVTEFGMRHGVSTVALLVGVKRRLTSYDERAYPEAATLTKLGGDKFEFRLGNSLDVIIDETDLLFIDTKHTKEQLSAELNLHHLRVRRWIAMHDTTIYGQNGEDGGPGLLPTIKEFLEAHPEWFAHLHYSHNNGLTILSKLPGDRPPEPVLLWTAGDGLPGTELTALLESLGITPPPGCDCKGKAHTMDMWGVARCREKIDTIVGWMREGQDRWKWTDKLKAAAAAFRTGLVFKINWLDPFPDLVGEAIRLADEKHKAQRGQEAGQ